MVHFAGAGVWVVWVFEVEVEVASLDLLNGDAPRSLGFFALAVLPVFVGFAPPLFFLVEFLNANGFAFVVAFGPGGIRVLVIPDIGGGLPLVEEQRNTFLATISKT